MDTTNAENDVTNEVKDTTAAPIKDGAKDAPNDPSVVVENRAEELKTEAADGKAGDEPNDQPKPDEAAKDEKEPAVADKAEAKPDVPENAEEPKTEAADGKAGDEPNDQPKPDEATDTTKAEAKRKDSPETTSSPGKKKNKK